MWNEPLVLALIGGIVIGLSSLALMAFNGRIAGISGIVGGMLDARGIELGWRSMFVFGLLAGGLLLYLVDPSYFGTPSERPLWSLAVAGLLVGFGTRLGSGCTSGHGICGLSRFSPRSAVAVGTFMASGIVTVALINALS